MSLFEPITNRISGPSPLDISSLNMFKPIQIDDSMGKITLLPDMPATTNTAPAGTPGTSNYQDLLKGIAQRAATLPSNAPAYQYSVDKDRRYDIVGMHFKPAEFSVSGTDTEDLYGQYQSFGRQLVNSFIKTQATAAATFASTFLSIPASIDLIRQGKYVEAFDDNTTFSSIQNFLRNIEDEFPNYYTQVERERPWYLNAITPIGAANFWGDKVMKNIGFSVGALGAGIVQDAAIEFLTAGTATPAVFIGAANQIKRFGNTMFKSFRDLTKVAQEDKVGDIFSLAQTGAKISDTIRDAARVSNVAAAGRYAATTYLTSQGEAFIEGYNTYVDTKRTLYERALNNELPESEYSTIEKRAQDAGRWTTGLNMPIIMASNLIQFKNLLLGRELFDQIPRGFIKTQISNEAGQLGIKAVSNYNFKTSTRAFAKETFKDYISESFEEGSQYFIGNSLHDYYVDRYNPEARKSVLSILTENAPKVLDSKEFYEEMFIGGLAGVIMGGPVSINRYLRANSRVSSIVDSLNTTFERFNSSAKQFHNSFEIDTLDPADKDLAAYKSLYNAVLDGRKFGTFEAFRDSIVDLKSVDVEQYNKMFESSFESEQAKNAAVDYMLSEIDNINTSLNRINSVYRRNPYRASNFLISKIRDAFSTKTEKELNRIQEFLFEEFKQTVGFNQLRLQKLNNRFFSYKEGMRSIGINDNSIDYLILIGRGDKKGVRAYMEYKKMQLNAIKEQRDYYLTLDKSVGKTTPPNITIELRDANLKIEKLEKMMARMSELANMLTRKLTDTEDISADNQDVREELINLVLEEEVSDQELNDYAKRKVAKELEEMMKKAAKDSKEIEALEAEQSDMELTQDEEEESKTASKIIDINAEAQGQGRVPMNPPEQLKDKESVFKDFKVGEFITVSKVGNVTLKVASVGDELTLIRFDAADSGVYKLKASESRGVVTYSIYEDQLGEEGFLNKISGDEGSGVQTRLVSNVIIERKDAYELSREKKDTQKDKESMSLFKKLKVGDVVRNLKTGNYYEVVTVSGVDPGENSTVHFIPHKSTTGIFKITYPEFKMSEWALVEKPSITNQIYSVDDMENNVSTFINGRLSGVVFTRATEVNKMDKVYFYVKNYNGDVVPYEADIIAGFEIANAVPLMQDFPDVTYSQVLRPWEKQIQAVVRTPIEEAPFADLVKQEEQIKKKKKDKKDKGIRKVSPEEVDEIFGGSKPKDKPGTKELGTRPVTIQEVEEIFGKKKESGKRTISVEEAESIMSGKTTPAHDISDTQEFIDEFLGEEADNEFLRAAIKYQIDNNKAEFYC